MIPAWRLTSHRTGEETDLLEEIRNTWRVTLSSAQTAPHQSFASWHRFQPGHSFDGRFHAVSFSPIDGHDLPTAR